MYDMGRNRAKQSSAPRRLRSSPCDSTLEELAAAWAGEPAALEALPLAARGSLASLRSLPTAATAGSQSSCSTAAGWALMSSGSSPCMASPAAPHAAGSHGGERERELWATRAEAVTYAVQLRGLEHLAKRVRAAFVHVTYVRGRAVKSPLLGHHSGHCVLLLTVCRTGRWPRRRAVKLLRLVLGERQARARLSGRGHA